jgi:hypothetical protein
MNPEIQLQICPFGGHQNSHFGFAWQVVAEIPIGKLSNRFGRLLWPIKKLYGAIGPFGCRGT